MKFMTSELKNFYQGYFSISSNRRPHLAGMRSNSLEFMVRLLGHVRQGDLNEDEKFCTSGQGENVGLRSSDDPEGNVLGSHSTLRRLVCFGTWKLWKTFAKWPNFVASNLLFKIRFVNFREINDIFHPETFWLKGITNFILWWWMVE